MKKGFTLIELLAVIIILAILMVIAVPNVLSTLNDAKQKTFVTQAQSIWKSAEQTFIVHSLTGEQKECYDLSNPLDLGSISNSISYVVRMNIQTGKVSSIKVRDTNQNFEAEGVTTNGITVKVENSDEPLSCENSGGSGGSGGGGTAYLDGTISSAPKLGNLIPIKYDGTKWVYANTSQKWYDYANKEWANAVVLSSGVTKNEGDTISESEIDEYKDIFNSSSNKYTYDIKKNIVVLDPYKVKLDVKYDSLIALYLLDYVVKDDISFVAKTFDYDITLYEDFYGTEKRPKEYTVEDLRKLAIEKAKFIYETKDEILNKIKEEELEYLFNEIEMPLSYVLADMELTGIKVNTEYLEKIQVELKEKMEDKEHEIYKLAGSEFNIMSPMQLAKVLFEDLEIPYPKKVKDGKYSTSKDILDKISFAHPIVNLILEYRTLAKLYTNYAVGLLDEVRRDGRIHTIYTQALTRTGRLSSISPNLQNIPARGEYSSLIRSAFVPDSDSVLLSSDYSQVELRVFAHMSNTENLINAFVEDKDIHTKTASDIYKVPMEEVTKDMRRTAKAVNFGILYGISSFGLSEDLGIDITMAKDFIDNYLETYLNKRIEFGTLESQDEYLNIEEKKMKL